MTSLVRKPIDANRISMITSYLMHFLVICEVDLLGFLVEEIMLKILLHTGVELGIELAGWRYLKVKLVILDVGVAVHGVHGVELGVVLTLLSAFFVHQ